MQAALRIVSTSLMNEREFAALVDRRVWLSNTLAKLPLSCSVLMYGSAISGTAYSNADVDFALGFPSDEADSRVGAFRVLPRENHINVLNQVYTELCKVDGIRLQRIFTARVPILQFIPDLAQAQGENSRANPDILLRSSKRLQVKAESKAPHTQHFDISASLDGCRNSLLVREYMEKYPRLRALTLVLKLWARRQKFLNARRGWISPYALTIMVVHFGIAKGISEAIDADSINAKLHIPATHLPFEQLVHTDVESSLQSDLQEFFRYYSLDFDFDAQVVDIRHKDALTRKSEWLELPEVASLSEKERWHLLGYEVLLIRDPYEGHSLGRSVDFFRGESLREAFRLAAQHGIDWNEICG